MKVLRTKQILSCLVAAAATIFLSACGGSGTYSPSVTGVIAPAQVTISISPANATTYPGGIAQFIATVTGTNNTAVTWSVVQANGGSITSSGLYTAPQFQPEARATKLKASIGTAKPFNGQSFTIMGVSQADPTKSATATIAVANPQVSVTPSSPTVVEGQTVQLAASVSIASSQAVTWTLNSGGGTVSASGLYTAPLTAGTAQVQATSTAYPNAFGLSNITVVPAAGITVSVTPPTAQTDWVEGASVQFSATVTGSQNQNVTWSIVPGPQNAVFGQISSSGVFTPLQSSNYQPTVTIKATSVADPTKFATAIITILNDS